MKETTFKINLRYLRSDTIRKYGIYKFKYVFIGFLRNRTFRPIITMRLCQATQNYSFRLIHLFFRQLHAWACNKAGIDLQWPTKIGPGFCITHGWGIVISGQACVGKNVTIFHGATIGQRDKLDNKGNRFSEFPIIEDEVWIGPNSTVIGGITIGRGSRLAAGCFVFESIPPYSTVVGNPAKIVRENCQPDVYNPAP